MHTTIDQMAVRPFTASALGALVAEPELAARRLTLGAGDVIHEDDVPAENIYFIHRGQVRLYQVTAPESIRLLEILGRDDWFGIGALAKAATYGVRAVAVAPSVVSEVNAEQFQAVLAQRPEVLAEVSRDLARRVMAAREDASVLIFEDCNQRLIRTLVRFSQSAASTPRDDGVVLHITHSQLAQAVGAARETVSLALTQLRHRNLLRTGRNQLFFNPEVLRRAAIGTTPAEKVA